MSHPEPTPLRHTYRAARSLRHEQQLADCVDQLQHPELIAAELVASHACVADRLAAHIGSDADPGHPGAPDRSRDFYASRDVFVVRDSSSFTCLATDIVPSVLGEAHDDIREATREGLDYLAITCTASPRPVLGAVQSDLDASAYPLLLRLFANLCEVAHASELARLDRSVFKGMLGAAPSFDLHLVLWDDWIDSEAAPERTPISQLTHDLAELAKHTLARTPAFPPILRDIVCLNMNPKRFDGRVRFDWRV